MSNLPSFLANTPRAGYDLARLHEGVQKVRGAIMLLEQENPPEKLQHVVYPITVKLEELEEITHRLRAHMLVEDGVVHEVLAESHVAIFPDSCLPGTSK